MKFVRLARNESHVIDVLKNNLNAKRIDFTLRVRDSKKAGHRLSAGGWNKQRRMVSACWHVHRDVMIEIFDINPSARLHTALAKYEGKTDFYEKYEETGYKNVGSQMFPACPIELCECHG
jgi:hypothetical protein